MTGPIRTGLRMVSLGTHIDHGGAHRRSAVRARLRTLLATLTGQPCPDIATASLLRRLQSVLDGAGPDQMWLALAVLDARLPDRRAQRGPDGPPRRSAGRAGRHPAVPAVEPASG